MVWHAIPAASTLGDRATFNQIIEAHIDGKVLERQTLNSVHQGILDTPFDLSNGFKDYSTDLTSRGDFFDDDIAPCPSFGCLGIDTNKDGAREPFRLSPDPIQNFVARFRGYLNVTPDKAGKPLHFGFYFGEAGSFTVFNNAQGRFNAIIRPIGGSIPAFRTTKGLWFQDPGLYPIEVLYAQASEARGPASIEMSMRDSAFSDIDGSASSTSSLKNQSFTLASPSSFFVTTDSKATTSNLYGPCWHCPRRYAGSPNGNEGCEELGRGYRCNEAAICEACKTDDRCGNDCKPCSAPTPFCDKKPGSVIESCVECTKDDDCSNGRCDPSTKTCKGCNDHADCANSTGRCHLDENVCIGCNDDRDCADGEVCDLPNSTCVECTRNEHCPATQVCAPELKQCVDCNQNSDCERGKSCSNHECVTCSSNDSCAGNSCNCCPEGTQCASPSPGASPSCVECTTDSQCAEGKKCDPIDGRCVDSIPKCNTSESCGASCVKCPTDRPFCFDGQVCVACRNDLECGEGQFCLSGECSPCTTDRHCGLNCEACGKPDPANPNAPLKPFCLTNGSPAASACVACRNDADCPGGTCDVNTNTCINTTGCETNCAQQGKVCNGSACVECFADAHCPCGGSCDVATGLCTTSCDDGGDCLGTQFCSTVTQQCEDGRRKPGTTPNGGSFCCEATAADLTSTGTGAFMAMLLAGFLLLYSRRSL